MFDSVFYKHNCILSYIHASSSFDHPYQMTIYNHKSAKSKQFRIAYITHRSSMSITRQFISTIDRVGIAMPV